MDTVELFVKVKVDTFQELGVWVARCAALRLSANGASREEAFANLREVMEQFFFSCVERGNILDVLRDQHVEHHALPGTAEQVEEMTVPVPLLADAHARRPVH
jgi:predicted RNase H-like HicB family nuclease